MEKYIAFVVIVLAVLALVACSYRVEVLGELLIYNVISEVYPLNIQMNAADFAIVHGDKFSVERNLCNLTVF
jgi:hypothetical protein